jgi:hypothetical protein
MRGTESEALQLQRSLSDLCQHSLLPAIETALNRCAPAAGHLYIERLTIDVGSLPLERLAYDLAAPVTEALAKALREQMALSVESVSTPENHPAQHRTEQQFTHEVFVYFLTTGSLPWDFCLPAGKTLEQTILAVWQEAQRSGDTLFLQRASVRHTLAYTSARKRLTRQFSPVFWKALLDWLSPENMPTMERIFLALRDVAGDAERIPLERRFWETMFARVAAGHTVNERQLVEETWHAISLAQTPSAALVRLCARVWPEVFEQDSDRTQLVSFPVRVTLPENSRTRDLIKPDPSESDPLAPAFPHGKTESHAIRKPFAVPAQNDETHAPASKEGIYLDCAGLVLLHPFLPRFFAALGITRDDELVQPDRALCLLHYLATGQQVAPEYELILPKILCNVPLGAPVEAQVGLTAAELEEAAALLKAVIRHWEVLRDSSIESLRGTFLVRAGKVSLRDDGDWLLQVEAKGFDILLEQLPWGIGMIQLPWMPKMLWVEWR